MLLCAVRLVAVIPARWSSTRFPGKPLADLHGKPMVQHVYERARAARGVAEVLVATDDARIAQAVESFGGRAIMTSPACRNGTERVAEAARRIEADVILNVQGDEPLLDPRALEELAQAFAPGPDMPEMATLARALQPGEREDPNVVKVVTDAGGRALYFSRAPLAGARAHVGVYGYTRGFLQEYVQLAPSPLEDAERLEQLRALWHGLEVRVVDTSYRSRGVDTPEDLERARHMIGSL
jgi:3-deoxy-manno-octulosonate cytidylyltransferase (CMP-KDO synthetase)